MFRSNKLQQWWAEVRQQVDVPGRLFRESFFYLRNTLHYCLASILVLLSGQLQAPFLLTPPRPYHRVSSYPWSGEGSHVDKGLANLPDVQITGLNPDKMRILAWNLATATSPVQLEGILNRSPRSVVEHQLIKQGNKYSGIFKIISLFEGPGGAMYEVQGTAFAVTRFHVLTSAHNVWDRKLGPAKMTALFLDEREDKYTQHIKACVSVASHAKWVGFQPTENDFCMVAIAQPFEPEVCILQCHPGPRHFSTERGTVVGFPFDLPDNAPGKHLILSEGMVACHGDLPRVMIQHEVNTVEGNSGSPVIVGDQVVGVHSAFMHHENKNRAAPVNQNGNNIGEFISVLNYLGGRGGELPKGVSFLDEVKGVCVFGEDMAMHENGKGFNWSRGWEEGINQTLEYTTNINGY